MSILRLPLIIVAEFRWRLRKLVVSFQIAKVQENLPALESPNGPAVTNFTESILEEDKAWLKKMLVKYPYWLGGHSAFALLSLQTNEIAGAYASAQAMQILSKSGRVAQDSNLIIAKCYLRKGVPAQAVPLLEELNNKSPERYDIAEELAAAYVGCAQYSRAAELFAKIPPAKISAQGHAAKMFVDHKVTQQSK
jgi:hypothetical protein